MCHGRNADLIRSLGAANVIDYSATDFSRSAHRYHLMIDIAGRRSAAACRRVLERTGTCVVVGGPAGRWLQPAGHVAATLALAPLVPQRMAFADAGRCADVTAKLATILGWIADGEVRPVIHRSYKFEEIPEAVRYQEAGHCPGKVVVSF